MAKFHTFDRFKAHIDIDEVFVDLIKDAYQQINDNMECVTNFFDIRDQRKRRDGVALTKKLSGRRKIEYKIKSTRDYLARTRGDNVTFAHNYLSACRNSYLDATTNNQRESMLAEFAGTIVHEAAHAALGNEKYAYLIDHFYRHEMGNKYDWTGADFVASNAPSPSWLPQDYANEAAVRAQVNFLTPDSVDVPVPAGFPPMATAVRWFLS